MVKPWRVAGGEWGVLLQPHARSAAIGGDERDPGFFEGAGDGLKIVSMRRAMTVFEIDNNAFGYRCSGCKSPLIYVDETSGCSALRW